MRLLALPLAALAALAAMAAEPAAQAPAAAAPVIDLDQDTSNPIDASQKMADAAKAAGVDTVYATVPGGTHLEAYLTFASPIFEFLDARRK